MHYDDDERTRIVRETHTDSTYRERESSGLTTAVIVLAVIVLVGIIYLVTRDKPEQFPVTPPAPVIVPVPQEPAEPPVAAPVLVPTPVPAPVPVPDPGVEDAKRAAEEAARAAREARDAAREAADKPVIVTPPARPRPAPTPEPEVEVPQAPLPTNQGDTP